MGTITIIIIFFIAVIVIFFAVILKKTNNISEEATMLVAYAKYANKGKDPILDREKTQEQFDEEKFKRLMQACFLANRFATMTNDLARTHHFSVRENGPTYGEFFEVQLGPFILKITLFLNQITESLPQSFQSQVDAYMRNPLTEKSKAISQEMEESLFPKSKFVKKYSDALRKSIVNSDFMYTLFAKY